MYGHGRPAAACRSAENLTHRIVRPSYVASSQNLTAVLPSGVAGTSPERSSSAAFVADLKFDKWFTRPGRRICPEFDSSRYGEGHCENLRFVHNLFIIYLHKKIDLFTNFAPG